MAQGATKLRYSKEEQGSVKKQSSPDPSLDHSMKLMEFAYRMGQGSVSHSPTEAASSATPPTRKPPVPQLALQDDPNRGQCLSKAETPDQTIQK